MMGKPILLVALIFIFCLPDAYPQQDIKIKRKEFKTVDQGFKRAWKAVKNGDDNYEKGGVFYKEALKAYVNAYDYNQFHPGLNYKTGICYYYLNDYEKTLEHLNKALEIDGDIAGDIHYFIARSYHLLNQFDKAIEQYNTYKAGLPESGRKDLVEKINHFIEYCQHGKQMKGNKKNIHIKRLTGEINSPYDDYYPVIAESKDKMYFSSRRPQQEKEKLNPYDNRYYEKIFVAYQVDDSWKAPLLVRGKVNSRFHNDVPVMVTGDDQGLYFYRSHKDEGDILYSERDVDEWSKPDRISRNVNSGNKETSMYITRDAEMLFLVSDRKGTIGGKDIFMATRKSQKRWNQPENMGAIINTAYDEEGVYFHEESKTLYFASKGHQSMGGYDLYKTSLKDDMSWTNPENLGYPLNSAGDDLFLTIDEKLRTGYFSSDRTGGAGQMDIYRATFIGPEKELMPTSSEDWIAVSGMLKEDFFKEEKQTRGKSVTILKGLVKDSKDSSAIAANIEIVDSETNTTMKTAQSDSTSGSFLVTLPAGHRYGIAVSAKDYLYHSEYMDIPASAKYQEIEKDIYLLKIEIGSKMILKNIYFEEGESTLRPESFVELGFVVKVLRENPNIQIMISGHTDNVGGYSRNIQLSRDRAASVVNYLVSEGIEPDRLESQGFGFTRPIASNDTEEGRQKNRRVEFEIIGK